MKTEYWIIGSNRWSKTLYTKEEAIKLSKTLINCENCEDCRYCRDCVDCNYCEHCQNCKNCDFCSWCSDDHNKSCYGMLY